MRGGTYWNPDSITPDRGSSPFYMLRKIGRSDSRRTGNLRRAIEDDQDYGKIHHELMVHALSRSRDEAITHSAKSRISRFKD